MYEIRLQLYFVKLATNGKSDKAFMLTLGLVQKRAVCPCPRGYIHVEKHKEMNIKSESKEIWTKLETNARSEKGFLLTVCPKRGFLPLPRGNIHVLNH